MTFPEDDFFVPDDETALTPGVEGAESKQENSRNDQNEENGENMSKSETTTSRKKKAPSWSFGVIRILRVVVGVVVLFALMFNFHGSFERVIANPEMGILALAAITQFIQLEDIERLREIFNR